MLGPLQDRGLVNAYTQKACPKCAVGHAPGVGNSCEACVPCEMDIASERDLTEKEEDWNWKPVFTEPTLGA